MSNLNITLDSIAVRSNRVTPGIPDTKLDDSTEMIIKDFKSAQNGENTADGLLSLRQSKS